MAALGRGGREQHADVRSGSMLLKKASR